MMDFFKHNKKMIYGFACWWLILAGLFVFTGEGIRNVFIALLALFAVIIRNRFEAGNKNERIAIDLSAILFAVATVIMKVDAISESENGINVICGVLFLFVGMFLLFQTALRMIVATVKDGSRLTRNPFENVTVKKHWAIAFAVTFFMLFIWLLRDYPGNMSVDSITFVKRAVYDQKMKADLPPILIIILRGCLNFATLIGADANFGVATYNFLQIIFESVCIAYLFYRLAKIGISKVYCCLTLAFFTLVPYNVQFSHTIWKDIPFSFFCMIFMLLLWEQTGIQERYRGKNAILYYAAFGISGIAICILRTNGYYGFIFFIPFGVLLFWKKRKDMCAAILVTFVLAYIFNGPISDAIINANNQKVMMKQKTDAADAIKDNTQARAKDVNQKYGESGLYVVTCQMIARVAVYRDDLTQEDIDMISEVFDMDEVKESYCETSSHYTLAVLNRCEPKRYIEILVKLGLKYPSTYLMAWRDSTYGYWYPEAERYVFDDAVVDNDYGIKRANLLPHILERIKVRLEQSYRYIPGYGLMYSIGLIVWITAVCFFMTIARHGWHKAVVYIPIVGVWATLLVATPVFAEFRYLYSFFTCIPISLLIPYVAGNINNKNEDSINK